MSDAVRDLVQRAVALHGRGQAAAAAALCEQILAQDPGHFDALHLLGVIEGGAGRVAAAIGHLNAAVAARPESVLAWRNLGFAQERAGRPEAAIASYGKAVAIDPGSAEAWTGLANALLSLGRVEESIESYRQAIAANPAFINAHTNLAAALARDGRHAEAIASCRAALALSPQKIEARMNLGHSLRALNRFGEALESFRAVLGIRPNHAEAHVAIGNIQSTARRYGDAVASYRKALAIAPDDTATLAMCVYAQRRMCAWPDIAPMTARLLDRVRAGNTAVAPMTLLAIADDPGAHLACARRVWAGTNAAPAPAPGVRRAGDWRIRLGYLSADFREHAVATHIAPLAERHDRTRFEVLAFAHGPDDGSAMRRRLDRAFDAVIDVQQATDAELAGKIAAREIDILVELMGHTKGSRAGVLARRPAPVQVHYLGYPGTTGADFIDYQIVDPFVVPPEGQAYYTEKLAYLRDCFQINDRERPVADRVFRRGEHGLPENGFVFCSFNNAYKITPQMFDIWMRLLDAVPGSVLWLSVGDPVALANLQREAAARGVAPQRLVFAGRIESPAEHLARYRLADLFLDTLPYNAHATASDALWAGLPVLTCAGRGFAARVAGSLLRAVGLAELVTGDLGAYEALALGLAREPERLGVLRRRLAGARSTAPLFDTGRTCRQIESAYRQMWETWCRGAPPRSFAVE